MAHTRGGVGEVIEQSSYKSAADTLTGNRAFKDLSSNMGGMKKTVAAKTDAQVKSELNKIGSSEQLTNDQAYKGGVIDGQRELAHVEHQSPRQAHDVSAIKNESANAEAVLASEKASFIGKSVYDVPQWEANGGMVDAAMSENLAKQGYGYVPVGSRLSGMTFDSNGKIKNLHVAAPIRSGAEAKDAASFARRHGASNTAAGIDAGAGNLGSGNAMSMEMQYSGGRLQSMAAKQEYGSSISETGKVRMGEDIDLGSSYAGAAQDYKNAFATALRGTDSGIYSTITGTQGDPRMVNINNYASDFASEVGAHITRMQSSAHDATASIGMPGIVKQFLPGDMRLNVTASSKEGANLITMATRNALTQFTADADSNKNLKTPEARNEFIRDKMHGYAQAVQNEITGVRDFNDSTLIKPALKALGPSGRWHVKENPKGFKDK